jgi:hypothetical protein
MANRRKIESNEQEDGFVTQTGLLKQGWTLGLIQKFLGPPDKTATNGVYRSAAPVKLFSLRRVTAATNTLEFRAARDEAARRSAVGRRVADTKRNDLFRQIEAQKIHVPALSPEKARARAIHHYNSRDREETASPTSDPLFLDRITVNYLRHELTSYDDRLQDLYRKVGHDEGVGLVKKKVLDAIAVAYPHLAAECTRQFERYQEERNMAKAYAGT